MSNLRNDNWARRLKPLMAQLEKIQASWLEARAHKPFYKKKIIYLYKGKNMLPYNRQHPTLFKAACFLFSSAT